MDSVGHAGGRLQLEGARDIRTGHFASAGLRCCVVLGASRPCLAHRCVPAPDRQRVAGRGRSPYGPGPHLGRTGDRRRADAGALGLTSSLRRHGTCVRRTPPCQPCSPACCMPGRSDAVLIVVEDQNLHALACGFLFDVEHSRCRCPRDFTPPSVELERADVDLRSAGVGTHSRPVPVSSTSMFANWLERAALALHRRFRRRRTQYLPSPSTAAVPLVTDHCEVAARGMLPMHRLDPQRWRRAAQPPSPAGEAQGKITLIVGSSWLVRWPKSCPIGPVEQMVLEALRTVKS